MAIYSCDFETTTCEDDCRVWAWAFCDIQEPDDVKTGTNLTEFMYTMQRMGGIAYFHNIKFDGNFIIYWLFLNGYEWNPNSRQLKDGQFSSLISDMGTWYTITIKFKPYDGGIVNTLEIRDSLKIIPMSVEDIPKAFGLAENKLSIDYNEDRPEGHILTPEEVAYVSADVIIVAKALRFMRNNGQTKLTAASNAMNDFRNRYGKKQFDKDFPTLSKNQDADIRKSYKGGWTYLNPVYKNKDISNGSVYDVNSMYPWAMKNCLLPYGKPIFFNGQYQYNENYPLYIINFLCEFKLKPGKYPSIQLKHTRFYQDNEYIVESVDPTVLTLTSVDYELFLHNYDVDIIEFYGGYMFKAKHGIFNDYIDYWYNVKEEADRDGNPGMKKIAKLMLNSLYGKFGSRMDGASKIPWYDEEKDIVRYKKSEVEERKGGYVPIATFITSYCRDKIIRTANLCGDRFIYADTDSVHIVGNQPVGGMDIDNYRLGAFKLEEEFIRGKFIRQKTYLEVYMKKGREEMNLKCCGMPDKLKKSIREEDFYEGAVYDARENPQYSPKLMPKVVSGGVILRETTFQIKKTVSHDPFEVEFDDKGVKCKI